MSAAALAAALAGAAAAQAATLTVTVHDPSGSPLVGAVITAVRKDAHERPAPPVQAAMSQVDLSFKPDLLVVPVGSSIDFPNNDTVSHQIYSFSAAKRFQLPLYRGKPYPPVRFDQPGLVTLGCNIHDAMLAYIVVTDAPHFGRSDTSGAWTVQDVSPGDYHVLIWHPRLRDAPAALERDVTVSAGDSTLDVNLNKPLRPAPIADRPHSWDAY
jgi:plastocyanin